MPTDAQTGSYGAGSSLAQCFFDQIYGTAGVDLGALTANYVGAASGMVYGTNPPYTLQDFAKIYPKFFGPASAFTASASAPVTTRASVTEGSNVILVADATGVVNGQTVSGIGVEDGTTVTGVNGLNVTLSTNGLVNTSSMLTFTTAANYKLTNVSTFPAGVVAGSLIVGTGVAGGSLVTAIDIANSTLTLSQPLTVTGDNLTFNLYISPFVPLVVAQLFINLALQSVMQARWQDMWALGMALYIAHNLTLWMRSETGPNSTAAQIVASGINVGIMTSKSVGDVSAGMELVKGFLDNWGAYNQTLYGIQFATYAAGIGAGPINVGSTTAGAWGY